MIDLLQREEERIDSSSSIKWMGRVQTIFCSTDPAYQVDAPIRSLRKNSNASWLPSEPCWNLREYLQGTQFPSIHAPSLSGSEAKKFSALKSSSLSKVSPSDSFKYLFTYAYRKGDADAFSLEKLTKISEQADCFVYSRDLEKPLEDNSRFIFDHIMESLWFCF